MTQMRTDIRFYSDVVQRQVYIDSFCFTLLVPAPNREEHSCDMQRLEKKFREFAPNARLLQPEGHLELVAGDIHVCSSMSSHIDNYPLRYTNAPLSNDATFSDIISGLVRNEKKMLIICITREEIEAENTTNTVARLHDLVQTKESAMAAMQRVVVLVEGYDEDARDCWEIPEVRTFLRKVFAECPYLFFLAMPEFMTITVFAACFCDPIRVDADTVRYDICRLREFLDAGFCALNVITQRHAISIEINKAITEDILKALWPEGGALMTGTGEETGGA
jgi:hypothetical protein